MNVTNLNYGWICPVCGAVMNPTSPVCYYCQPKKIETTSTVKTNFKELDKILEFISKQKEDQHENQNQQ